MAGAGQWLPNRHFPATLCPDDKERYPTLRRDHRELAA
jgi:hypothetical protein